MSVEKTDKRRTQAEGATFPLPWSLVTINQVNQVGQSSQSSITSSITSVMLYKKFLLSLRRRPICRSPVWVLGGGSADII